jgi:hypothetical protein
MQLAVSIDLAAVLPSFFDQIGLAGIFFGPFAKRVLQPSVKSARVNTKASTHRTDRKYRAMLIDESVPHFASLAKYTVAFFNMSRSSVTRASSRFNRLISADCSAVSCATIGGLENRFIHV